MAQKGMSLNPGADPTLVAAAYRSAMANVPKDLSGTYEALAASYDKTMKSVAASWSGVIKDVATLGSAAVATAIKDVLNPPGFEQMINYKTLEQLYEGMSEEEAKKKRAEIGTYEEYVKEMNEVDETVDYGPGTRYGKREPSIDPMSEKEWEELNLQNNPVYIGDELIHLRKEIRKLFLKTDRASTIKRQELKSTRDKLFTELEFLENVDNFNNENLKNGLIDEGATGKLPLLMQNALSAYKTKSKVIPPGLKGLEKFAGYHVIPTRDSNEDLHFVLKDKQGRTVTGIGLDGEILTTRGGKPYSISTKKMQNLLTRKYDETKLKTWNKLFEGELKSDTKIFGYDGFANKVRAYVPTEEELHGLIGKNPGASKSNLVDELTLGGPAAAELFGGINQARLKELGIDDMADGTKGYSASDFTGSDVATTNYKIVKDALLNRDSDNYDFKTTQNVFVKYATDAASEMHVFTPTGNKNIVTNPFGTKSMQVGGKWLSASDRWERRKIIKAGKGGFDGIYGSYKPTEDGWTKTTSEGTQLINMYTMLQDEQLLLAGDEDPSVREKREEDKFSNYSADDITKTAGQMTNDKDIVNAFNQKYKDSKFKFDATFTDNKEMVYITYKGGSKQGFLVSGDLPQQIANYMNFKNPKDGATMKWPGEDENKGKTVIAKDGKWKLKE